MSTPIAVYRRFVVTWVGAPRQGEIGRYEDPAVAWRDVETRIRALIESGRRQAWNEYTVTEIRTPSPATRPIPAL